MNYMERKGVKCSETRFNGSLHLSQKHGPPLGPASSPRLVFPLLLAFCLHFFGTKLLAILSARHVLRPSQSLHTVRCAWDAVSRPLWPVPSCLPFRNSLGVTLLWTLMPPSCRVRWIPSFWLHPCVPVHALVLAVSPSGPWAP